VSNTYFAICNYYLESALADFVDQLHALSAESVAAHLGVVGVTVLGMRHAFASRLDDVSVPGWCGAKRRRTPAATAIQRMSARAAALGQWRLRVEPLITQKNGRQEARPTAQAQWPRGYTAEGSPPRRAPGSTPEARA
jgi:hypothetical protein